VASARIKRGWPIDLALKTPKLNNSQKLLGRVINKTSKEENAKVWRLRTQEDHAPPSRQEFPGGDLKIES